MLAHPRGGERAGMVAPLLLAAAHDSATTIAAVFAAETLSWAGVPAIGAAAIGAAGALASQDVVPLWAVIVAGTVGAELGSFAGWWLGLRVSHAGIDAAGGGTGRRAQALATGERFEQRWGPLVVFFVPSWVSGALGMAFRRFAGWNFLAAFLWTLAAGLGAYGIGSAISGDGALRALAPLLVGLAALAAIALLFAHRLRRRSSRTGDG
jgi:membrane protein DedA with SNARE-associated domain